MKNRLSYYTVLAKKWAWMVILGIVLCGSASFGVSKITTPVYQASATLILNVGTTNSSYENFTVSVQAVPTYVQLLTSPQVLNPVAAQHPRLVPDQLKAMITVKTQPNTPLIELDVQNRDPRLAMDLANEVSQSLQGFASVQLPGTVQILPAQMPTVPIRPKVLENTVIGALVGLGLALALIVIFEWLDDRLKSPEEVQELLGMETLTAIPWLPRGQRAKRAEEIPALAESYRLLAADLDLAQKVEPFKLVMVTSALAGEGKSSIATNLASFLAMAGKRVLLVDADLRSPALEQHFELEKRPEPASAFTKAWAESQVYLEGQLTDISNLHVLTAEVFSTNFMGLLSSPHGNQFLEHLQEAPFDYVIFDTPPLLPAADTQILASYVQAIMLVVDPSKTPRKLLLRVRRLLDKMRTPVVGVVINKSRWPEHGEIRRYMKDALHHRTAIPAMPRPPETPSVNGHGEQDPTVVLPAAMPRPPETSSANGHGEQDPTVVLPAAMPRPPETPSANGHGEQDLTVVLPPMPDRLKHLFLSDLMGQDLTVILPRLKPPKEDLS
jgi:polysaccharide biosynthesis transport protein